MDVKYYKKLFDKSDYETIILELYSYKRFNTADLYEIYINACINRGEIENAIEKCKLLILDFPDHPQNYILKARISRKQLDWKAALENYDRAVNNNVYSERNTNRIKLEILDCCLTLKKSKRVLGITQDLLSKSSDPQVMFETLDKLIRNNLLDLVDANIYRLESMPNKCHLLKARLYVKRSNWLEAITQWEKLCELVPLNFVYKINLLRACHWGNDQLKVRNVALEIISNREAGNFAIQFAFLMLIKGYHPDLIELYVDKVKNLDSKHKPLLNAFINYSKINYTSAIAYSKIVLRNRVDINSHYLVEAYRILIDSLFQTYDLQSSLVACKNCIKDFPTVYFPYMQIVNLYRANSDIYDESGLDFFVDSIKSNIDDNEGLILNYCKVLDEIGEDDKAFGILESVVHKSEKYTIPLLKKYLSRGNFDDFLNYCESKIQSIDIRIKMYRVLINTFIQLGHFKDAVKVIKNLQSSIQPTCEYSYEFDLLVLVIIRFRNILCSNIVDVSVIINDDERMDLLSELNSLYFLDDSKKYLSSKKEQIKESLIRNNFFVDYTRSSSQNLINTHESPDEVYALVNYIKEKIQKRVPCSIIRLGDGEGSFLRYPKDLEKFQTEDQKIILNIWWPNGAQIQNSFCKEIEKDFLDAIENADVLGVSPPRRHLKTLSEIRGKSIHGTNRGVRGLIALSNFIQTNDYSSDIITSSYFQSDLESWDAYQYIFEDVKNISVISCHESLGDYLIKRFGFENIDLYKIPGEYKSFKQFDQQSTEKHYPDVYTEVSSRLKLNSKNKVFLVAGGFLGKIYCNIIKQNGGVAIDIGSIVDKWLGYNTRGYHEVHVTGNGIRFKSYPTKRLPKIISEDQVRTNFYHNKILSPLEIVKYKINVDFLVTGHPRTGTGYVSQLFNAMSLEVGHEKLGSNGISSWLHAVKNQNIPFFSEKKMGHYNISRYDFDFKYLLLLIRDPAEAIPSIVVENRNNISYSFRRFHIFQELNVDMNKYSYWLDKAIVSYLSWIKLIEKQNPKATLKLESIEDDLVLFLKKNNIPYLESFKNSFERSKANSTKQKYGIEKPKLSKREYRQADPLLITELKRFCNKYGYPISFIYKHERNSTEF